MQTIIDENPNANYYILEDTDGNKYYVASSSIINASTASFTGPCYQDDQATTLYSGRTLNLLDTSNVTALFSPYDVYKVWSGTGTSHTGAGDTLDDTIIAMIQASNKPYRYKMTKSDGATYYVMCNSQIDTSAGTLTNVTFCYEAGTYYTAGTIQFELGADVDSPNRTISWLRPAFSSSSGTDVQTYASAEAAKNALRAFQGAYTKCYRISSSNLLVLADGYGDWSDLSGDPQGTVGSTSMYIWTDSTSKPIKVASLNSPYEVYTPAMDTENGRNYVTVYDPT